MKIDLELDYKTILRNSAQPVHLVAKLTAPTQPLTQRARPAAFTVVLDRSGSMDGAPLENAKKACCEVIKNLRPEDSFSLVVFDDSAQVVIPLEKPINRHAWYQTIDQITAGASTNLMAGWLLGRDELMKAQKTAGGIAPIRKILLLTDGHLNAGITEPDGVEALTRAGLEKDEIRTSCLGFGDGYNENILAAMSKVGQGQLHDADTPEKFSVILADELDGLQKIAIQNLRLRIQPKLFCNAWKQYGDYHQVHLPDERTELALGDLVSGEERYVVLLLDVLPLPLLPDGCLPASLEGEELVGLEFAYTSIRDEGTDLRLESHTSAYLVRIQGTQNPDEVVQNTELIAVIMNQHSADAVRKAADALAGGADPEAALRHFESAKLFLSCCTAPELASEAAAMLDEHEQKIRSQELDSRSRKNMRYEARYYGQTSSARLYTGSGKRPRFTKKPTVDERLNEKSRITQEPPKLDPNTYWVVPGKLLAGEYPGAQESEEARRRLRKFLQAGVRHFIDLTEAGKLEPYDELLRKEGGSRTSYTRIPIRDESVPEQPKTMAAIIAAIDRGMAEGGITYIHCWGGVGRTGLAVACWLQQRGQTSDEALTNLADRWRSCAKSIRRPRSPETSEQVRWVKKWPIYRSMLKSPNDP